MAGYKRSYSLEEDNLILKMIVSSKSYNNLKGVAFWKELEYSNFKNSRTWMSLKNRFIRSILPRINNEEYTISASEKQRIVDGYFKTSGAELGIPNIWSQQQPEVESVEVDSDSEVIVLSD